MKFGLVFFAYDGRSVWSFLLTFPPSRNWVWSFLLAVPSVRKLGLVFSTCGSPTVSKNADTASEKNLNLWVAVNRVFGKPCFCPLPKRGRFDENGENDEFAFYPLKTRASLLRPRKSHNSALQSLRRRPYTPCHPQSFFS